MSARKGWRVIWRVIAPGAGGYGHDMVFIETGSEAQARKCFEGTRAGGWLVCLERVERGPLPGGAARKIATLQAANAGNTA